MKMLKSEFDLITVSGHSELSQRVAYFHTVSHQGETLVFG